ncbi:DUF4011 domain-containing protein [Paractinoplanes atraurantiacus]|uniref:Part of AAA domain-containing protein n=1 Tax=Paractinoplanes atraurantiacus TaxID=1036182 RepID=A0A285I068_9ACTN|nr:DUF4011 domain-containing protein [Actinoplanes atraurantiacus]SNY41287.1 Part of AAA domain-containing protein [Actinoplanes atraurantiacus]
MSEFSAERAALRAWRDGLVNLDAGNRLLNFKRSETGTVDVQGPPAGDVVRAIRDGREYGFLAFGAKPEAGGLFKTELTASALGGQLRRLLRKSRQDFLDRGVPVLHLAAGMLRWRDEEDVVFTSPVLLLPVELTALGPGDVPRLRSTGDDPVVNPALSVRLRRLGVDMPAAGSLAELDVPAYLARLREAIGGRDWHADETVLLSTFSFHKEAMYRDLLDNEERIAAHPLIRALAGGEPGGGFDPIPTADIDRLAPPEDMPLVLDADASQRSCVAAAVAGHSFVLDGPPGTGKSQTIANMIGCLLHAGKRVLFVSEKAAALEVVHSRLASAGLDGYLLELHSHKATRKEVARELAAALDDQPVPGAGSSSDRSADPSGVRVRSGVRSVDREQLRDRRERLSAYAVAMNEVRQPLGRSLYEVLGSLGPAEVPLPDVSVNSLTPESLERVGEAADELARCWRPIAGDFLWRDVIEREPLDDRLRRARAALRALAEVAGRNGAAAEAFSVTRPSQAGNLAALVTHAARRPDGVPGEWLTTATLEPVGRSAERRSRDLTAVRQARVAVRSAAGVEWHELPDVAPPALEPRTLTADAAEEAAHRHLEDADMLDEVLHDAGPIASRLGLPPIVTFADLARLAAIADLASRPNRPEPFWFGAGVLATVSAAATALRRSAEAVAAAEAQARRYFHESIVEQPVEQLSDRLTNVHRGLRKLFRAYRRDWEAVAAFAQPAMAPAEAVAHLGTAVAWKVALREQAAAERQYAPLLGRYWRRQATDFNAIHEAVQVAGEVLRLSPPEAVPQVADQVGKSVPGMARIAAQARRVREPQAETIREEITALRAQVEPLKAAATALRAYSRACERDVDLAEALRLARLRKAVVEAEEQLASRADEDDTLAGLGEGLDEAIGWAAAARRLATGTDRPLTEQQAAALSACEAAGTLAERAGAWQQARDGVIAAFAPGRHEEISAALDAYTSSFLDDLIADRAGQEEWFGHLAARRALAAHGMDAAVGSCAEQRVPPEHLRGVLDRALLAAWADAVIRSDRRLHPGGSAERDRLVEEFRRMDAALAGAAPAAIATVLSERKAAGLLPEDVALLRREGMKETRHLAVRELIGRARDTVLAVKPCFLMSPLAVSQFLPSDLSFDVVVFDEASQITPGDAVNCVYRASAMIVAGDDKQLPPTSFFAVSSASDPSAQSDLVDPSDPSDPSDPESEDEPSEDAATDVNDFQSVLELAKACGAFRTLALAWHYRSRHEALIAFANHAFYQARLITFPCANASDPEAGVELILAGGVYRRGTTRDNPVEAERVAERIVHSLTTRPEESLGVVTFSVAQAEAIEAALDRAVAKHPGLERFLDGDRLNGLFVKSLESVQGDERDVMIFSIGYAHDEEGKISTNFGALNQRNGVRRLNVAITRARRRVEIVSSIRSRDIPASANAGVRHLSAYLEYAERGLAPSPLPSAVDPMAEEIAAVVESWGYRVRSSVGADRFRVEVGVRHPAHDGEVYALGIQCDGPRYASIAAARDRDRISAEILAGLGWRLHRIWGTAWHRDRPGEEARLRAAIEEAVGALPASSGQSYRRVDLVRLQPVS